MQQNYKYLLKSIVKNIKIFPGKKKKKQHCGYKRYKDLANMKNKGQQSIEKMEKIRKYGKIITY